MISQIITVDIGTQQADEIHYVQGETGRQITFNYINSLILDENEEPVVIDASSYDCQIHILKADGNFIVDNLTPSGTGSTYTLDDQCCVVGGRGIYDISLTDSDNVIYTAHGNYIGDNRAIADGTVNSISEAYGVPFPEGFQEKLIPGENITIEDNVISSTGGGGSVGDIDATASVDSATGTPSVVVTKTTQDDDVTFDFAFHNLKGVQGATGATGSQGPQGPAGADGADGAPGVGVPTGGTAGQVLSKIDSADYNTEWTTPQSGGGYSSTTLFENNSTSTPSQITLADNISHYDQLVFECRETGDYYSVYEYTLNKSMLTQALASSTPYIICPLYLASNLKVIMTIINDTEIDDTQYSAGGVYLSKICGIKY